MRAARASPCTTFFQVCRLYDARNEIVHRGRLSSNSKRPDTWFIAALLLGPVLTWFASHPDGDLIELDADIAALPTPAQPPK
jgi:proteasome lid subunit RPN8/RPN11